ncbi:hypothetical protein BU637_04370 [Staphylococcus chromogenes]|nr:hypothetical protein BU637_04370 [Staphylococcus chromogenes]
MLLLYLVSIIVVLWIGQRINQKLLEREWIVRAYIVLVVILSIQAVLIYHFVNALLKWLTFILKLFYK